MTFPCPLWSPEPKERERPGVKGVSGYQGPTKPTCPPGYLSPFAISLEGRGVGLGSLQRLPHKVPVGQLTVTIERPDGPGAPCVGLLSSFFEVLPVPSGQPFVRVLPVCPPWIPAAFLSPQVVPTTGRRRNNAPFQPSQCWLAGTPREGSQADPRPASRQSHLVQECTKGAHLLHHPPHKGGSSILGVPSLLPPLPTGREMYTNWSSNTPLCATLPSSTLDLSDTLAHHSPSPPVKVEAQIG